MSDKSAQPVQPLSIITSDVWKWTVADIKMYLQSLLERGLEMKPDNLAEDIAFVYATLIEPSLEKKQGTPANPYHWSLKDSEETGTNGKKSQVVYLHTVAVDDYASASVTDNTNENNEDSGGLLLTDFYTAFGWLISAVETNIHDHASAQDHPFCRELVIRFARVCRTMHMEHFKCRSVRGPPAQAFILYGPVGAHPRPGFDKPNAASLSTSVSSAPSVNFGSVAIYGSIDFKDIARRKRAKRTYIKLSKRVPGGLTTAEEIEAEVEAAIREETARLAREAEQAEEEAEEAQPGRKPKERKTPRKANPAGNCAEWLGFAARLHPETLLFGLCVKIDVFGRYNDLAAALAGDSDTPTCKTCGYLLKFLGGKCDAVLYEDQAKRYD